MILPNPELDAIAAGTIGMLWHDRQDWQQAIKDGAAYFQNKHGLSVGLCKLHIGLMQEETMFDGIRVLPTKSTPKNYYSFWHVKA